MVVIIDYGMGNVSSVQKALNYLGIKNIISNDHKVILESNAILLPGVGSFQQGMLNLEKYNLVDLLTEEVIDNKKRFFGVCLGMQLIMEFGSEPNKCKGLGWIPGSVEKIKSNLLRVPHLGWNDITVKIPTYFEKSETRDFYFIHSYHVLPTDKSYIAATVDYGGEIVACIQKENIFATQFHPEKSQKAGLAIIENFFKQNA